MVQDTHKNEREERSECDDRVIGAKQCFELEGACVEAAFARASKHPAAPKGFSWIELRLPPWVRAFVIRRGHYDVVLIGAICDRVLLLVAHAFSFIRDYAVGEVGAFQYRDIRSDMIEQFDAGSTEDLLTLPNDARPALTENMFSDQSLIKRSVGSKLSPWLNARSSRPTML